LPVAARFAWSVLANDRVVGLVQPRTKVVSIFDEIEARLLGLHGPGLGLVHQSRAVEHRQVVTGRWIRINGSDARTMLRNAVSRPFQLVDFHI
jgi:hypothetical protein